MSSNTYPPKDPFEGMTKPERRRAERAMAKDQKKAHKQMSKAAPGDGIPVTMRELKAMADKGLTPVDGVKFKRALQAYREEKRQDDGEVIQNLSFTQIWKEFVARKRSYQKRHGKRPTGVMIGQIEAAIFAQNREHLEERKMIRSEPGTGGRVRLYINNMYTIVTETQSCIAPFHFEPALLKEQNPYAVSD